MGDWPELERVRPAEPEEGRDVRSFAEAKQRRGRAADVLRSKMRFAGDIEPPADIEYLIENVLQPNSLARPYGPANVGTSARGSIVMVWRDPSASGALPIETLGEAPKEIVDADGVLLVKRK